METEKQMEIQNDQLKDLDKAQDTCNPQYKPFCAQQTVLCII